MDSKDIVTTKILRETLRDLRHIHAETGETLTAILQRLISAEWQRLQVSLRARERLQ